MKFTIPFILALSGTSLAWDDHCSAFKLKSPSKLYTECIIDTGGADPIAVVPQTLDLNKCIGFDSRGHLAWRKDGNFAESAKAAGCKLTLSNTKFDKKTNELVVSCPGKFTTKLNLKQYTVNSWDDGKLRCQFCETYP